MESGQHRIYDIEEQVEDAQTAAGMINYILRQALLCRASDIHLEGNMHCFLFFFFDKLTAIRHACSSVFHYS